MRGTLLVLSLLATLLCVYGAVSQGNFKSDEHPGKCVLDDNTILSEGETITRNNCQKATCHDKGDVTFESCGVKSVESPCKFGKFKYPDADYPKCCINVVHCPGGDREI